MHTQTNIVPMSCDYSADESDHSQQSCGGCSGAVCLSKSRAFARHVRRLAHGLGIRTTIGQIPGSFYVENRRRNAGARISE